MFQVFDHVLNRLQNSDPYRINIRNRILPLSELFVVNQGSNMEKYFSQHCPGTMAEGSKLNLHSERTNRLDILTRPKRYGDMT